MTRPMAIASALLAPLAIATLEVGFALPDVVERIYSRGVYPGIARTFGAINRTGFSWAEVLLVPTAVIVVFALVRAFRKAPRGRRARRTIAAVWTLFGVGLWLFLLLWGFNYARPSLETRMGFAPPLASDADADATVLLDAGQRVASRTRELFGGLEAGEGPTKLPLSFDELDRAVDRGYRELALPGDAIRFPTTPAKPLESSTLFAYLGISGIFVPFTGEPSVNDLQPDVALPLVWAHEKAHQRGITNEGEANFAAFLVCSRPGAEPYLRYAAYLFATEYLLGEASAYFPREVMSSAWNLMGEGPKTDVRAEREFWKRYEGRVSEAASEVNDTYLKALRVPEGVESYGTVTRMLLALDREGRLVPPD